MNDIILDHKGQPRMMGVLPPKPNFGDLPKFRSANPILPRSQWKEIDYSAYPVPILDQGQHGSCVGHGAVTTFWRAWLMAGGTPHDFSACYIYGKINGGQDGGAVISDAMTQLVTGGVCLLQTVPEGMVFSRQFPKSADAEAARFKVAKAYHLESFDEIGSAFQLGFLVCGCVRCGNNFTNLDSNGIPPVSRGMGNHCLAHSGLIQVAGQWVLPTPNSWGTEFGMNGFCRLTEKHYTSQSGVDCFAIQVVSEDPQETPSNLPLQVK